MDKKKILICDDEEGVRESLNLILEKDYAISFASNGEEALNYIKKNPVDLLILDIKMPKVDGLEVLREIKSKKPDINIVIATGYQSTEMAQETIKFGVTHYITKPFDKENVLKTINNTLR